MPVAGNKIHTQGTGHFCMDVHYGTMVKWAGGLYLIFLGLKLLRSNTSPLEIGETDIPDSRLTLFWNTWLVTASNPKGIVFFVAFLPQFISPDQAAVP